MHAILSLDDRARADLVLLLDRAAVFGDGTVRLLADGDVALLTTPMTASAGLLDFGPTVLIARAARMREAARFDGVVALPALRDALREGADIEVPDALGRPAWAAVSPPRGGWTHTGDVDPAVVRALATQAATDVEAALPAIARRAGAAQGGARGVGAKRRPERAHRRVRPPRSSRCASSAMRRCASPSRAAGCARPVVPARSWPASLALSAGAEPAAAVRRARAPAPDRRSDRTRATTRGDRHPWSAGAPHPSPSWRRRRARARAARGRRR